MLPVLQYLTSAAWLVALFYLTPGLIRYLRGRSRADELVAVMWAMTFNRIGYRALDAADPLPCMSRTHMVYLAALTVFALLCAISAIKAVRSRGPA